MLQAYSQYKVHIPARCTAGSLFVNFKVFTIFILHQTTEELQTHF
jgi:hypothetical protein